LSEIAYTSKARDNYLTLQTGVSREQRLYKDWTVLLRADGQWADTPLISNEQFGMGGVAGVRGYTDGENYGDTGWRVMFEPRTPMVNLGMVDGDIPFWVRASVFMDYGETYLLQKVSATSQDAAEFWGCGASLTANIGSHLDARLTVAWPLLSTALTPAGDFHFYFGVGAQF
jgi:hemolysin activation/secretion protein